MSEGQTDKERKEFVFDFRERDKKIKEGRKTERERRKTD
jgi:hypothetical protein